MDQGAEHARYRWETYGLRCCAWIGCPPCCRGGEVLVRVRAAGVDRGVWDMMTGLPYLGRLAFGIRKP